MDQELTAAAAYALGKCCMCTHQMAALFCVKFVMAAVLKDIHTGNCILSIDTYLPEEQSCQISS